MMKTDEKRTEFSVRTWVDRVPAKPWLEISLLGIAVRDHLKRIGLAIGVEL